MSTIDRIRESLRSVPEIHGQVAVADVEALCDLADAFRDRERTPSYTVNCDCADCAMYRAKIMDAHKRMRDALSRLDGDAEGE